MPTFKLKVNLIIFYGLGYPISKYFYFLNQPVGCN